MKLNIVGEINNGELVLANEKGCDEIEVDLPVINYFSLNKDSRFIGVEKNLFKLTLKSYKELKKEFQKRGSIYQFDYSKR